MSEHRAPYNIERSTWDLEIATDTDRINQQVHMLKRAFPTLDLLVKTRFFCILGCALDTPLTDAQKAYLEQLREVGAIYRWRCGKQKL